MKKVYINSKNTIYEWHWKQKHTCGCITVQKVLGGQKPTKEKERLSQMMCPVCKLNELMKDYDDSTTTKETT